MEKRWRIEMFGGIRASAGKRVITHFRTRKTAELLGFLAYHRGRNHPREVLIELLWPEGNVDSGRHSLSMALSVLRQHLDSGTDPATSFITTDRHSVGLNSELSTTDVSDFEEAFTSASESRDSSELLNCLRKAAELYSGEFMSGHYGEWILPEQQRLEEAYHAIIQQLVRTLERDGNSSLAISYALRAVSMNRLREEAHRELIRLFAASGQRDAALRQFTTLTRLLKEELDCEPSEETSSIINTLKTTSHAAARFPEPTNDRNKGPQTSARIRLRQLEPVGGAVPIGSRYYVTRTADEHFEAAIHRRDSTVLIKGPRQVGKSSLLARGLQHARERGDRVILTHFQTFNDGHFESPDTLLLSISRSICEQLDLPASPEKSWDEDAGANPNFRRFMRREVLPAISQPLVWGMDEADRLMLCRFASQVFGLFRSWHDERALEPDGPWKDLSLAIAYSTEPYLFIQDVNQSPFNIGTRVLLEDFTIEDVRDLDNRYGSPLGSDSAIGRLFALTGGQPYLVQRSLYELVSSGGGLPELERRAATDDGIFGDHLRRIRALLAQERNLRETVSAVLTDGASPSLESFHRLRSAGILTGDSVSSARMRCTLYSDYLRLHLSESVS